MNRSLYILIAILLPISVFATGQIADLLIYKGDTLSLFSNPLEPYLDSKAERTINGFEITSTSTACYRGYKAIWKINNDSLFLLGIQIGCSIDNPVYFDLSEEFGSNIVFANWFSGKLLIPKGNCILYIHDAYESIYENEVIITFKNGKQSGYKEYDNSKSYQSEFAENESKLITFIYSNINWDIIPDLKDNK